MKKVIVISAILFYCSFVRSQYADLVLFNGKIITVDADNTIADAVAVQDSLILQVGTRAEIEPLIGPDTDVRNLNGRTVTPGMIDAHLHLMYYGQGENDFVNLRPPAVTTIQEAMDKIKARIDESESGEWIMGDGFFKLEDMRLPTKYDMDPISPENPVFLNSMGGHYGCANSKALEIAGITAETPDPVGGIIERDSTTGEPNGVLWNHPAMDLVRFNQPPLDPAILAKDVIYGQEKCLIVGLTSYQDVNTRGMTRVLGYYTAVDSIKVRAFLLFTIERSKDADISLGNLQIYKGPKLSLGGDKFLLDGQPPTSYTYEPHPGPSWDLPTWDPDTLQAVVIKLHRAGHQLAFHAMGDAAIDLALDVIEAALEDTPRKDHRHRIEHCMIPTDAALERIKRLGVVVSIQPMTIYQSAQFYVGFWGADRAKSFKPMRTMLDMGIPVALGTDYPTTAYIAPKYTLWSAVTRMSEQGFRLAGDEAVTIQEAMYAHTMGAAYAAFEEDVKGSIETGKYADMTVWSDDMYSIPVSEIKDLYVISTIVGGTVYNNPNVFVNDRIEPYIPSHTQLLQNYPNPFNAATSIVFELSRRSMVQIDLLNVRGQFVQNIVNDRYTAGRHKITFEAALLPSGVYFLRMKAGRFMQTGKLVFVK
ncbi:amidohydrolase family protein [candidate division KSB1 bacterium]|nr:amidohydrolase family protein [candidate division KSB1 bacterium]